jgi:hypothetical protein
LHLYPSVEIIPQIRYNPLAYETHQYRLRVIASPFNQVYDDNGYRYPHERVEVSFEEYLIQGRLHKKSQGRRCSADNKHAEHRQNEFR